MHTCNFLVFETCDIIISGYTLLTDACLEAKRLVRVNMGSAGPRDTVEADKSVCVDKNTL